MISDVHFIHTVRTLNTIIFWFKSSFDLNDNTVARLVLRLESQASSVVGPRYDINLRFSPSTSFHPSMLLSESICLAPYADKRQIKEIVDSKL